MDRTCLFFGDDSTVDAQTPRAQRLFFSIPQKCSTDNLSHNTLESRLEPPDSVVLADLVALADLRLGTSPSGDSRTRSRHAAVEVHTVDTDGRVVLDTQVDVF